MEKLDYLWNAASFPTLSIYALYEILKFRMQVFVLEQRCIYLDLDDLDQKAYHITAQDQTKILAYARIFIPQDKIARIQRVCVHPAYRKKRLGSKLIEFSLSFLIQQSNVITAELNAQYHLQAFYAAFGFETIGDPFDEDGILHIKMKKKLHSKN